MNKQDRRHERKHGRIHLETGGQKECPNCGSKKFGKHVSFTPGYSILERSHRMDATYCTNCGHGRPHVGGFML